jgi:general secretion pathway protein A
MYERFFKLVDAPFRLTPDPRYLFLSQKHAEALAHLRLGLEDASGFVCITGEIGAGKTTLLRSFLAGLGPEVSTAYVFNPTLSPLELVQRVCHEFGLPANSTSRLELVDALNEHLLAQRRAGRVSVVVVDEAQALSIEVLEQLRLLSNLETSTEKLLRLVLVGQPQLRLLLTDPGLAQLNQRITLRWHLGPLARDETAAYVRHRLAVASRGKVAGVFSAGALRLVHRWSEGTPRLINMIAHRAMLAAYIARRQHVTARTVRQAYGEIEVLPLPIRRRPATAQRAAWGTAAAAVVVALGALGLPHPDWWLSRVRRAVGMVAVAAPQADRTPADMDVPPAAPRRAAAAASVRAASPLPLAAPDFAERLTTLDAEASERAAVAAVLAAWHVEPLAPDERVAAQDLEPIAWRRGLQDLQLMGNLSMLRLLDLPAILEVQLGGAGRRWLALTRADEHATVVEIDGTPFAIDETVLRGVWPGRAQILWRDFESLGPTLSEGGRGPEVTRLQALLRRVGTYGTAPSGEFDAPTANAVLGFQRAWQLLPDGQVGRLTRIVLYAAAGGYRRPTLVPRQGGAS